jgi:hypothetical protein
MLRGAPAQLKPIGSCSNIPTQNLYSESNKNTTFPYTNHTLVTSSSSGSDSGSGSGSKSSSQNKNKNSAEERGVSILWMICGLICGGVVHSVLYFIEF